MRMKIREARLKAQNYPKTNSSRGTSADDSSSSAMRRSSRRAKAEPVKAEKDEEWVFDCVCGAHGINYVCLGALTLACQILTVWL